MPRSGPVQVLCIDDHVDVAESTAILCRFFGLDASPAYSGLSALSLANQTRPDVCVCDIDMPGMSGLEFAHRLQFWAGGRPIGLIAVSANDDDETRILARRAGFDLFFRKPADPQELIRSIIQTGQRVRRMEQAGRPVDPEPDVVAVDS